jgi:hypothetical protein
MGASDLIKALQNTLRGGGRPHMGNPGSILTLLRLFSNCRKHITIQDLQRQ